MCVCACACVVQAEGKFDLARRMEKNTNRYVELFSVALDDALKTLRAQLRADTTAIDSEDVVDVMQKHRAQQMAADGDEIDSLPARLVRRCVCVCVSVCALVRACVHLSVDVTCDMAVLCCAGTTCASSRRRRRRRGSRRGPSGK